MFSNQISTRELFNNSSQSTQERSYQNDFSQLQHAQFTQFDMSQSISQDDFTQDQYSSGSTSQSQGRRVPVIDKYMSKPSLFRSNSQNRISSAGRSCTTQNQTLTRKPNVQPSSYQQELAVQKVKAKERDERDMLSSIVTMVRECSDEVKHNMSSMRTMELDNGNILTSSIKSLTQSLEESSNKILKAVTDREEHSNQISTLNREIRQKDEKIEELLQLRKSKEGEMSYNGLLDSVKSFFVQQQSETEQKIQRVLESTQEQLKLTKDLGTSQRTGVEENNKHFMDMKYCNTRQVQDIEKRLVDELVTIRDDFDRQNRDMESFFRTQTMSAQQKHLHSIEQHIQKGVTEGVRLASDRRDELFQERQTELKDLNKTLQRETEKYIQSRAFAQTKQIIKQTRDLYNNHHRNFHKDVHQELYALKTDQKQFIDESRNCLDEVKKSVSTENGRPWLNNQVPKQIQDQLDELHNHHQSEIKRLETQIEIQRKSAAERKDRQRVADKCVEDSQPEDLQNVYDFQKNEVASTTGAVGIRRNQRESMFKNGPGLLSPRPLQGTIWNSRTLFGRTNQSPIATVLPQRQQVQDTTLSLRNAMHAAQAIQTIPDTSAQPRQLRNRGNQTLQPRLVTGRNTVQFQEDDIAIKSIVSNENSDSGNTVDVTNTEQKKKSGRRKGRKWNKSRRRNKTELSQSSTEDTPDITTPQDENEYANHETFEEQPRAESLAVRKEAVCIPSKTSAIKSVGSQDNVFEFHDELSPGPVLRKQNRQNYTYTNQKNNQSTSMNKWLAVNNSTSYESSTNSSPSLSITDIFIRRRVHAVRRSPEKTDGAGAISDGFAALSDFLSTPNLTELFKDEHKQCVATTSKYLSHDVRPVRRIAEKRTLCDFDAQMVHHSQKTKKY